MGSIRVVEVSDPASAGLDFARVVVSRLRSAPAPPYLPAEAPPPPTIGAGTTLATALLAEPLQRVQLDGEEEVYTVPQLFGVVEPCVYRSGFPTPEAFPFLRRLGVRTVINLLDRLPPAYRAFLAEQRIGYVHAAVKGNKAHCEEMDRGRAAAALALAMDAALHPVIIHCRSGKHRTGALVGCLRMLQGWSLEAACNEYVEYTRHKQRYVDKQYIERFSPRTLRGLAPPAERLVPWLAPGCTAGGSALEEAITRGELAPEAAEAGLPVVAAIASALPDEPGFPAEAAAAEAAAIAAMAAATAAAAAAAQQAADAAADAVEAALALKVPPGETVKEGCCGKCAALLSPPSGALLPLVYFERDGGGGGGGGGSFCLFCGLPHQRGGGGGGVEERGEGAAGAAAVRSPLPASWAKPPGPPP
jgi:tyrosine-protein phosphatase SIW14